MLPPERTPDSSTYISLVKIVTWPCWASMGQGSAIFLSPKKKETVNVRSNCNVYHTSQWISHLEYFQRFPLLYSCDEMTHQNADSESFWILFISSILLFVYFLNNLFCCAEQYEEKRRSYLFLCPPKVLDQGKGGRGRQRQRGRGRVGRERDKGRGKMRFRATKEIQIPVVFKGDKNSLKLLQ